MQEPPPTSQWPFWLILFAAPLVFYATEHSFRTSLSEAFTQTADEMLETAEGGNLIRRVSFPLFGLMGLVLVLVPKQRPFQITRPGLLSLAGLLLAWCSLSLFWSIDSSMTARRLFVLYCVVLAAWGTARHLDLTQILWVAFFANLAFLVIGFAAEILLGTFRPWAGEHRFSGTVHPNTQGLNLASFCFSALCLVRMRPKYRTLLWAAFWVGVVFLYLTKSRTSFLGLILTLIVIWTLSVPLVYKLTTVCFAVWFGSLVTLVFLFIGTDITESASDAALMGRKEQAESLTGRLPLWTELSGYVSDRLLEGHGYDSFWTPPHIDAVSSELGWGLREAHNSYLEAVLGIGLIGAGLAVLVCGLGIFLASQAAIATNHPGYAYLVAVLFFGALNGFTESSMMCVSFYTYLLAAGIFHLSMRPEDAVSMVSQQEPSFVLPTSPRLWRSQLAR